MRIPRLPTKPAEQTLEQLRRLTSAHCPGFTIEDGPEFPVRAYMLDISRCKVPRMDHLFRLVDMLALFKFNQLQLYMEHTFAYQGHEEVWEEASPLTAEEVSELKLYCSKHYIELVPNQNAFGHMERWLKHGTYQSLAECPDGYEHPLAGWKPCGSVLYPSAESIRFVDGLLDQLLPCFDNAWVHLGCDEPWELGQGRSSDRVEQLGRHAVYKEYLMDLHGLVRRRGKRMLFWSDELRGNPARIVEFPSDMIPVAWGYEGVHDFNPECAAFARDDREFLVAPGDSSWNSFTGRLVTAARNIENAARAARAHQATVLLLTSWGDQGHQQTWPTQLPGLVTFASAAWNLDGHDQLHLETVLDHIIFRDSARELGLFWTTLARIDSHLPVKLNPVNSSLPYDAIYAASSRLHHAVRHMDHDSFFNALALLEDCHKMLDRASPDCADGEWILAESGLALEMTRQGLKRVEGILKEGHSSFPDNEWALTLNRFSTVWLRRNREGGLEESIARLSLENPKDHT